MQILQTYKLLISEKQIMTRSYYNCAHATTAQLSWHMQICVMIGPFESNLEQNNFHKIQLWPDKLSVQWIPVHYSWICMDLHGLSSSKHLKPCASSEKHRLSNILGLKQNGCLSTDDIFQDIFYN